MGWAEPGEHHTLVLPLDSCRVFLCSSLRVSGFLRHSKATRRCKGQQQTMVRGCRFSARVAVTSGATRIPGPQDDAKDPSHIRDTSGKTALGPAPTTPEVVSQQHAGNQTYPQQPCQQVLCRKGLPSSNPPLFFPYFLKQQLLSPLFLVDTQTYTHYMYTIWNRGATPRQGSDGATHSAAAKGEVV